MNIRRGSYCEADSLFTCTIHCFEVLRCIKGKERHELGPRGNRRKWKLGTTNPNRTRNLTRSNSSQRARRERKKTPIIVETRQEQRKGNRISEELTLTAHAPMAL
jgi:hypothetical protein